MSKLSDWHWVKGYVDPDKFWDIDEIKSLSYKREDFNDVEQQNRWREQGFTPRTGQLFDMRHTDQPKTTELLIKWATDRNIENVGVSYYCMEPGDNLPYHKDTYKKYIELFDLEKRKKFIVRYVFFVEDRKAGHIFEVDNSIVDWQAGTYVAWRYDLPHMAANFGTENRFTIQLTGVMGENIKP